MYSTTNINGDNMIPIKKTKRPTAQKRIIQNEKRRLINRSHRSEIRTTIRQFEESIKTNDQYTIQTKLNSVYSMLDSAVSKGIYKQRTASRTKSRMYAKSLV
jgi:small subunit ribosomal protein S20